jgi:hypothetical protein
MEIDIHLFHHFTRTYDLTYITTYDEETIFREVRPILRNNDFINSCTHTVTCGDDYQILILKEKAKEQITKYYTSRLNDVYNRHMSAYDKGQFDKLVSDFINMRLVYSTKILTEIQSMETSQHVIPIGLSDTSIKTIKGILSPYLNEQEASEVNELFAQARQTFRIIKPRAKILIKYIKQHGLTIDNYKLTNLVRELPSYIEGDRWILESGELNRFINKAQTTSCTKSYKHLSITHGDKCKSSHLAETTTIVSRYGQAITGCTQSTTFGELVLKHKREQNNEFRAVPKLGMQESDCYLVQLDASEIREEHSETHLDHTDPVDCQISLGANCILQILQLRTECHSINTAPEFNWPNNEDIVFWYGYLHSMNQLYTRYLNILSQRDLTDLVDKEEIIQMCVTAYEDGVRSSTLKKSES